MQMDATESMEIEKELLEAGNRLLKSPPVGTKELLEELDQVETCLAKVEQSPPSALREALEPAMKALIAEKLMKHSNKDINVSVAVCVSEITRITAPDAPYDDDNMKQIFQLIVAAFDELYDTASRSYPKRVSILETVAKVRSCVVMLDLECDNLILEMFQHFLKTIRPVHTHQVFASMETIMNMVIEESEEISQELLSCILDSMKKENQNVLPIAKKLGEAVLQKSAVKLKPYLTEAVKTGLLLSDYSDAVTNICRETSDTSKQTDANASEMSKVNEGNASGKDIASEPPKVVEPSEEEAAKADPVVEESPKVLMSNGTAQNENADTLKHLESPQKNPEVSQDTNSVEAEHDNVESSKLIKEETKPEQVNKRKKGCKPRTAHSTEVSAKSAVDAGDEPVDPSLEEAAELSEHENETPSLNSSPLTSPTPRDSSHPKGGRKSGKKKSCANQDTEPGSSLPSKEPSSGNAILEETPPVSHTSPKKESDKINELESTAKDGNEEKNPKRSHKSIKVTLGKTPPSAVHITNKESGVASGSDVKEPEGNVEQEEKPLKRSHKKTAKGAEYAKMPYSDDKSKKESALKPSHNKAGAKDGKESSAKKQGAKTNKGKEKASSEDGMTDDSSDKEGFTPLAVSKSSKKVEQHSEKSTKNALKREGGPPESVTKFGENLVGLNIKVFWPDDDKFYSGVIDSFLPKRKLHKVLYDDGEIETLNLKDEHWKLVSGDPNSKMGKSGEQSNDPSPEMSQKKKLKKDPDSAIKQTSTPASHKRGKGASVNSKDDSSSKPKQETLKESTKSKSKDGTPKTTSKSKDITPKVSTKSKDDAGKTGSASKDGATKSKGKSKSGSKLSANETPVATEEDKNRDQGSEKHAHKSEGKSVKRPAQVSETKSEGKSAKRRRK